MTVDVEDGRAVAIGGDPEHRFTQGFLCAKVNQYLERVYSPDRILHPLRRVGPQGRGAVRARSPGTRPSDEIAARFRDVIAAHGPRRSCPTRTRATWACSPTAAWTGASSRPWARASWTGRSAPRAGAAGYKATVGKSIGFDPEAVVHARLIVAWGANIVSSNVHLWPFIEEARRRGAKLVDRGPVPLAHRREGGPAPGAAARAPTAPWPSAMMHVIFRDGLEDRDYLERYTIGAERLRERVREWTPERAAAITGLAAADDRGLRPRVRDHAARRPSASTTA